MKKIQSTCNFCAIDCNLDFYVEDGRIVKTIPTPGYPVNDGFSCIKGLSLSKQQTTVKPNSTPKIRQTDGSFRTVSWDEGFAYVADKLKELQEKYGRESVAGISTGQLTLEEFAIFGHVMRNYLQTNVDGNTRLCMASAAVAHKGTYGYDAPGYTLQDLELSDTLIFIGSNPVVAHPIIWGRVRENKVPGRKIIVLDPRRSETARNADYWYPLRWRSDLVLMYTLANIIIENDWVDHAFVDAHTEGYADFAKFVKDFPVERGAEATGLSKEQILELAGLIHGGKAVSFWWTMGVNQGYEAVRTAQAIMNLAFLTGNIGKPGTLRHRPVQRHGFPPVQQHHLPVRRRRLHRRGRAQPSGRDHRHRSRPYGKEAHDPLQQDHRGHQRGRAQGPVAAVHQPAPQLDQQRDLC